MKQKPQISTGYLRYPCMTPITLDYLHELLDNLDAIAGRYFCRSGLKALLKSSTGSACGSEIACISLVFPMPDHLNPVPV
jgi:hypothetical protein